MNKRFTTIWNYITLKRYPMASQRVESFTTIWNYITLKRKGVLVNAKDSFTTIWNYITLKLKFQSQFAYLLKSSTSKTAITWQCNSDMVKIYSKI